MSREIYYTIFDVTTAGYTGWVVPASGLIVVGLGLAVARVKKSDFGPIPPTCTEGWFRWSSLGFGIFITVIGTLSTLVDYRTAVDAMREHKAEIVEGPVTDFHPHLRGSHKSESFVVQGVKFKYADSLGTAGFNRDASHGGQIQEGLSVRIWHLKGEILRLDIKEME